jgi:16S rRNA (cytosine1402-N4)-methyltransferase
MNTNYHIPVLLNETIAAMQINPNGIYVDCTLGGGGHATAILKQLDVNGKLIVIDQDADAIQNVPKDDRVLFIQTNFRYLQRMLRLHSITKVDGILADLGVSSHQFDEAKRGFSIRFNAALDMRMDDRNQTTAATILATLTETQLHKIMEQFGEVTNAKTLAKTIVQARLLKPILTIDDLKNALAPIVKGNPNKYFAQVFQALRIAVNEELLVLQELLLQLPVVLKPNGIAAIITFHSLEDRMVKNYFKKGVVDDALQIDENPFSIVRKEYPFVPLTKKPLEASASELKQNPRSRSAKLRVAMRNPLFIDIKK